MKCQDCPYRPTGIFASLSSQALDELERIRHCRVYEEDDIIFREGDPCVGMKLLCKGKVKLFGTAADGRQQILDIVSPCEIIAEPALVDIVEHDLTAQALEPVEVRFIHRADLLLFLASHGEVAIRVINNMGKKLRTIRSQVMSLSHQDARARMAALLLRLSAIFGVSTNHPPVIDLAFTREELAEMIGTTQETVIRILTQFRKEKLIDSHHRQIVLLDSQSLREMAGVAEA